MTILLRVLALGAACLLLPGAASAAVLKQQTVGNWKAAAYSNDQTGKFSHCAASASYKSGIALLFMINSKYEWSVGLVSDSWKLEKGARYPVSLRVDDGRLLEESAVAIFPTFVSIKLADSTALFQAFKFGRMLKVYAVGQTFSFQLTDTSSLLPSLLGCVKSYEQKAPQTSANPFVAEQPKPAEPQRADTSAYDRRAEATSLVANILSRSGVSGFEIMSPEQTDKLKSDAAWRAGGSFGTVSIIGDSAGTAEDVNAQLLASDSKACHDKFMSGSKPDDSGARLFTSCASDKQTLTIYYSTIKRPEGGYYVLATGGYDGQGGAKHATNRPTHEVDSGIRSAAFTVISR